MTTRAKIKFMCAKAGINMAELASRMGILQQTLTKKISSDSFTIEDYEKIAKACGGEFVYGFRFEDGHTI